MRHPGPKLIAEGTLAEEQIVLGWMIDTHLLLLKLPADKHDAWLLDLQVLSVHRTTTYGGMDSLVGKLNHVAFLILQAHHHFLTRLQELIDQDKPQLQQQMTTLRHFALDA